LFSTYDFAGFERKKFQKKPADKKNKYSLNTIISSFDVIISGFYQKKQAQ